VFTKQNGAQDATNASLTIRVPAARFAEVGAEIRKLELRVESEQLEAEDVTKQYVDQHAHLRNLRAQEAQYLTIMKQAKTVKDTLDVSEKLNGVRGEIEQQQAEFEALSKHSGNSCDHRVTALRSRSKCLWAALAAFVRAQTGGDAGP
jgi:hypothetical protein